MNTASLRKVQIVAFFDIRDEKGDVVAEGSLNRPDGQPHVIEVFASNLREYLDTGGGLDQFIEQSKAQLLMQTAPPPQDPPPPSTPNRATRRATSSKRTTPPKGARNG